MEGLDQFRGWFSSSLLLSVALAERAPFRDLVVHGFTTDSEGRKMSKSLGNVISPQEILDGVATGCTDVLRRWAATSALATRSAVSAKAFTTHAIAYKKVNNQRFCILLLKCLKVASEKGVGMKRYQMLIVTIIWQHLMLQ